MGHHTAAPTPKPMLERLSKAFAETLREPTIMQTLTEKMQITLRLGGPEELRKFVSEQMKLWGKVVRDNHIKGDA